MLKNIVLFALSIGALVSHGSWAQSGPEYFKLFTLERTLNANQVVYEVNPSNTTNPIHAYWVMLAQDGHLEELTRLERNKAYGTEVISQADGEIKFILKAFSGHPITVRTDPETKIPYAVITLASGEKILKDIYLTLSGGLIPGVKKVDLYYQDDKDGPTLHETIDPNSKK